MKKNNYCLTPQEKRIESVRFLKNRLLLHVQQGKLVFAFSSAGVEHDEKAALMKMLAEEIAKEKSCLLVNLLCGGNVQTNLSGAENVFSAQNLSVPQLTLFLQKNEGSVFLLNLPPVQMFAQALEYARLAHEIILVEHLGVTEYSAYEKTLLLLQENGLKAEGVIACL